MSGPSCSAPLPTDLEEPFLGNAFRRVDEAGFQPFLGDVLDDLAFRADGEVQRSGG